MLREHTIRWKEKAGFLVSPTPRLFLTEGCYLVAIIVYIGSNPAVFITQETSSGNSEPAVRAGIQADLGDGEAGLPERRREHLMRGETQPGGPSQC